MIDREFVKRQAEQAAQRSGRFRYLKKNSTTSLRVLEYENSIGKMVFAQLQTEHRRREQGGKGLGICRKETFGLPCAFCKANQLAQDSGHEAPFLLKSRYIINAIDINEDPGTVKLWVVPATVFNGIADYVLDDEWKDVLEAKGGYAFSVKREGDGLDTEYTVKAQRTPYPVDKGILSQVVDPIDEISDPGLEGPCSEIGVKVEDLFDAGELEVITGKKPTKLSKTQKEEPKQEQEQRQEPRHEPKSGSTKKPLDKAALDQARNRLYPPQKEKPETKRPKCFGDPNLLDSGDDECVKCDFFTECEGEVELSAAGINSSNSANEGSAESSESDDIVSSIIGNARKTGKKH